MTYFQPEFKDLTLLSGDHGSIVVKVQRYKSEGCWFDPRWCHWNFSLTNPSDRTMALGSTQPLTEMSTISISWEVNAAGE
jgi:hypothetical protein